MSKEDMIKEAVEEAKMKAVKEAEENAAGEETDLPESDILTEESPDTEREESFCEDAPEEDAEGDDQQEPGDEKEKSGKEKKKFGRKVKKDKKDEKIEELTDRLTRQIAEFDNFRKRTDKEKSQMYEIGARDIIEKILPVIDNFERGIAAVPEDEKTNPFAEGLEKIYKQLMTTFEEIGVKPIEAVGAEFNPDFHNAVMHVEDETLGENTVAEEFQKGYTYRDSVVRHSMVKVAN
ncbi:nucleotide exchange factor GrpE [Faecalicatena contorta]|uniref:Protein GrpE n=1 Tax=Faecalicatena contorta TaxID=39482 RepID=A0A316A097_9FIRM|nr:molecular chaperone GrpE [Faecalicatena contorta]SUQ13520.1 molecular chaperone GrpE [Faecalicatena contorta]